MNTQTSNILLSTFFANEFLITIMPKKEPILKTYRENIDNYCNSITAFLTKKNPTYEILLDKLISYLSNYVPISRNDFIEFTCSELCSKYYLAKRNSSDKTHLFRKFLTECIKTFAARALVSSKEYVDLLAAKKKEAINIFRKSVVSNFEIIVVENKNQLFSEFSCLEKGLDPTNVSSINAENRVLEELRSQNEELRFENMCLKEKLLKLTKVAQEKKPEEIKEMEELPSSSSSHENYDEDF